MHQKSSSYKRWHLSINSSGDTDGAEADVTTSLSQKCTPESSREIKPIPPMRQKMALYSRFFLAEEGPDIGLGVFTPVRRAVGMKDFLHGNRIRENLTELAVLFQSFFNLFYCRCRRAHKSSSSCKLRSLLALV